MELSYAEFSCTGPVRANNEDSLGAWLPEALQERRERGYAVLLADGCGGVGNGEVASRLAVDTALAEFRSAKPDILPKTLLVSILNAANIAVYDRGMQNRSEGRMATTLTVAILRNDELNIGHVGDSRMYLIRDGQIRCLTTDHTYVGLQQKMGLITEAEAMTSELRSVLTRSIGKDIVVRPDYYTVGLQRDDCLVQCCDGLYGWVPSREICEAVRDCDPKEACARLQKLAEDRHSEDNVSAQVIRVRSIERVATFMGRTYYKPAASAQSGELQVGMILDNRFSLTDVISRGSEASVFEAVDNATRTRVAIKASNREESLTSELGERFRREREIGSSMQHPGVLRVFPVEPVSRPYLVMEYLSGQTLATLMRAVGALPARDVIAIGSRLCDTLDYMHCRRMNIIHCDLKPENIMICNDGSLRIMDFGIAKATGRRSINFEGDIKALGTPDYIAPERVKGETPDERTDLYSLGVILYELAVGALPFDGPNPYAAMEARVEHDPVSAHRKNPRVPHALDEVIMKALQRERGKRHQSAAEMKSALDKANNLCPAKQSNSPRRTKQFLIWSGLMAAIAGTIFGLSQYSEKNKAAPAPGHNRWLRR